mgnify:FL=1|jgi:hypothetical protein|tara:strand:- start:412 stop:660 length:249 start_codon:yes stop_codon:yes gene_type:complete
MALTKTEIVDKVEVIDTGDWSMVQVRTATVIKEDNKELSRSFHRHIVSPADDWSSESDKVKAICDAVHNDTTKAAFEAAQAE